MGSNKSRADYMRDYRKRKREERGRNRGVTARTTVTPPVTSSVRGVVPTVTRIKRMKSDKEIRNHIAMLMRAQGQNPLALLHLLTGYITQLQDLMRRDRMDELADTVCERRHPGKLATGVYCKLCHDVEMAGRFGSIPGQGGNQLIFAAGDDQEGISPGVPEGGVSDEEILLGGVNISPLPGDKE